MSRGADFWSRRKAGVAAEAEAERAALRAAQAAEAEAALAQREDAAVLEELGLKDPDELEPGDDFGAYLREAIPQRLRQRALRRLWRTNPTLANLDGLLDYGEDFTDSATVVENMQTAYQVGKGMLRHVQAMAEAAERDAGALDAGAPADMVDPLPEAADLPVGFRDVDEAPSGEAPPEEGAIEDPALADADDAVPAPPTPEDSLVQDIPSRRRMRFEFTS